MLFSIFIQIYLSVPVLSSIGLEYIKLTEKWCLDGKFHKIFPGVEDELHSQCTPWKNYSCCTHNISKTLHYGNLYNFNLNHCAHIKPLSSVCKRHFIQDSCFYECEPNVRPWVVKVNMTTRKERFYKVPLCQIDCEAWFHSCADDYTCVKNWITDFIWAPGGNKCSPNDKCVTFREMYKNSSKKFCEQIWDDAWEETDDSKPCMRLWFDGTYGNPNEKVAELKLSQMGIGDIAMYIEEDKQTSSFPWFTISFIMLLALGALGYYVWSKREFNISLNCL